MDVIRRLACEKSSANAVWHLNSTHKSVKHKFIASSAADGCVHCIMWLKCSSNNKEVTACELFKEAINKFVVPLQAWGNNESGDRLIAKCIVISRITNHKGHISGRSAHNTRIECFWGKFNVNVMIHFRDEFQKLETLGFLDANDSAGTWALRFVCITFIKKKL